MRADAVFISAASADAYKRARETLRAQHVNDRLLDCSDAHNWTESGDKDSLGHCELWMKADPTFRGLQHALLEFDERVYIGSEPPKVTDVKKRPQRYIRSIDIKKVQGSPLLEQWFDCLILFNPGLVAIIGNKGSSKSALADIVALGGNSQQEGNFSFLNENKFRNSREDKSVHFEATLSWHSGDGEVYPLSRRHDPEDVERVRYIPQSYLEIHPSRKVAKQSVSVPVASPSRHRRWPEPRPDFDCNEDPTRCLLVAHERSQRSFCD